MTPEAYLTHCKADVIFCFFGNNESFAGDKGVGKFKTELGAMIDKYRAIQFNGKSAPRFVLLFSSATQRPIYMRNSWSNKADPVLPATVGKVREATKGRNNFWNPEELLKDHPIEKN